MEKLQGFIHKIRSKSSSSRPSEDPSRDEDYYCRLLYSDQEGLRNRDFSLFEIRVIVMREHDKLLYDSETMNSSKRDTDVVDSGNMTLSSSQTHLPGKSSSLCTSNSLTSCTSERSGIWKSKSLGGASCAKRTAAHVTKMLRGKMPDVTMYSELMFGSEGVKRKADPTKIHYIKVTSELLITKVFHPMKHPPPSCPLYDPEAVCPTTSNDGFISNGMSSFRTIAEDIVHKVKGRSSSLSVPGRGGRDNNSPSPTTSGRSSPSNGASSVPGTNGLRRRGHTLPGELYHRVMMNDDREKFGKSPIRGPKLSIGVIFKVRQDLDAQGEEAAQRKLEDFVFSHFPMIDRRIRVFKMTIEDLWFACSCNKTQFISEVNDAKNILLTDINLIYSTLRIKKPVFLTLLRNPDSRKTTMTTFMQELTHAVTTFDLKENNYFLSRLVTSVLAQHVGWIQFLSQNSKYNSDCERSHSFSGPNHNPLMEQFWHLYGAVNRPKRLCRTVLCGQSKMDISRLLYLLTYFIRCKDLTSQGNELDDDCKDESMTVIPPICQDSVLCDGPVTHKKLGDIKKSDAIDLSSREEDKIILARMEAMKINSMSQEESVSSRQLSSSSPPSDCNSQEVTSSLRHPICLNMQPSKTNSLPINPSQPEPVTPSSEGQFTPSSPSRSLFRQGHCSSRVSSDSGMYDRDDYSSASHPSSVLSDSFECCHKWSWNNIDPEKSLMLSKFTESQLTSDSWTCSCEQDRETLKDLGYLTKSIRKDRYDPDHFSPRKLDPIDQQFVNSLLAGYSENYLPDFVLHGTQTQTDDFRMTLIRDLEAILDASEEDSLDNSACCILADSSSWLCEILTVWKMTRNDTTEYTCKPEPQRPAMCVRDMLKGLRSLWEIGTSAEFCLTHLENTLKGINQKGELIANFIVENSKMDLSCLLQDMDTLFGIHESDKELLLSVASAQDKNIEQLLKSQGLGVNGGRYSVVA